MLSGADYEYISFFYLFYRNFCFHAVFFNRRFFRGKTD